MAKPRTYADQAAANVLTRYGLAAIWQLHLSAAAAYRQGKPLAAGAILEIADAAEREWLRRTAANLKQA